MGTLPAQVIPLPTLERLSSNKVNLYGKLITDKTLFRI